MIQRLAIPFLVLIATLGSVCFQAAPQRPDPRPVLLAFKAPNCRPCIDYVNAYYDRRTSWFRDSIQRNFRLASFFGAQRPDLVQRYRVDRAPTFIVIDRTGRELRRVVGFPGPRELIEELTTRTRPAAERQQLQPEQCEDGVCRVPETVPADPDPRLVEVNDQLRQQIEQQAGRINDLTADNREAGERFKDILERLHELRQARQQKNDPQHADDQPPDSGDSGRELPAGGAADGVGSILPDGLPGISPEIPKPSTGLWKTVVRHGIGLAVDFGLTQAQSEVLVPIVAGLGPAGAAVAVGIMAFKWYRRRKQKGEQAGRPDPFRNLPLPRDLDEARELLRLREKEGRHAIHDGLFGALADAELEKLIEAGDQTALKLRDTLQQRLNDIAPLSSKPEEQK